MKEMLSRDTSVAVGRHQVSCSLGDGGVILDLARGVYYGLDPVGSRIWDLLQDRRLLGEVTSTLLAEYDVEPSVCRTDLMKFLASLEREGLIEIEREST